MAFAKTDIGKAREKNQDYYYISSPEDAIRLYILADGMGGYKGGEVASRLATESAKNYIYDNFGQTEKQRDDILKLVKDAMIYANMVVYEKSKQEKELASMGTTLEVCLIYNNKAYTGHIGDSRIYRIRKDFIRKLTQDHSYVQKLVKDGTAVLFNNVSIPEEFEQDDMKYVSDNFTIKVKAEAIQADNNGKTAQEGFGNWIY